MLAALQTVHSKFNLVIAIVLLSMLAGCSRDNPLNIPEAYVEPPVPFCTDDSPFAFQLLNNIGFTNLDDTISIVSAVFSPDTVNKTTTLSQTGAPYLSNSTTITPGFLTDFKRDEIGNVIFDEEGKPTFIILNKIFTPYVLEYLTEEQQAILDEFVPETMSVSVEITHLENGETTLTSIDDETTSITTRLLEGPNEIVIKLKASVTVPLTGLECRSFSSNTIERSVSVEYQQNLTIYKRSLNDFYNSNIDLDLTNLTVNANDQLGNVVAVNDNFLVLGLPNESSDHKGIMHSANISQNDHAQNSGAVLIYNKNEEDNWQLHSLIKSSNNEAGDAFGSSIAFDNYGLLLVSAPGEDANASGIHLNSSPATANLKLNNTAPQSGAVYSYRYDWLTDEWEEFHYIKPPHNVITDNSFNKGFGSQLLMHNNLILISAPGEDSSSGNSSNSDLPDSGAVYAYRFTQNTAGISYVTSLKAFNRGAGDQFGSSIAASDQYIAVGAPFEDHDRRSILNNIQDQESDVMEVFENNLREDSGAVYIFTRNANDTLFEPLAYLKSSNSDAFDYFGTSLAFEGNTLFVGAVGEDGKGVGLNRDMDSNSLQDSGAVYAYSVNTTTNNWSEKIYIKADDTQAGAHFGQFLATDNGNLIISSPRYDDGALENAGSVYGYLYIDDQLSVGSVFRLTGSTERMLSGKSIALKNRHMVLGASGFEEMGSGVIKPKHGKVTTFK